MGLRFADRDVGLIDAEPDLERARAISTYAVRVAGIAVDALDLRHALAVGRIAAVGPLDAIELCVAILFLRGAPVTRQIVTATTKRLASRLNLARRKRTFTILPSFPLHPMDRR